MPHSADGSRDHLDHLPGRAYLLVVGAIPLLVLAVALPQLFTSHQTADVVWWSLAVAAAVVSLVALVVAWEERRAHIHAVVREVVEYPEGSETRRQATAELLRLGAHRELAYLQSAEGEV